MKVIVTGTTGMVGKGVLLECLEHPAVTEALSISRRPTGINHPKLKELLHKDFSEFASVRKQLAGYDACYHVMGVSSVGMKEEEYKVFTYDYTMALAKELHSLNPGMTFTYVSGMGTDSTEKGRSMWARVKGKTENDILKMGFKQAYAFRPGAIIPMKGVEPSNKMYKRMLKYLKWLILLTKRLAPSKVVDTVQIGLAMIHITQRGYEKSVINPEDIMALAK